MASFKVLDELNNPPARGTDALLQPGTLSPDSQTPSAATSQPAAPASTAIQAVGNAANTNGQPTEAAQTPQSQQSAPTSPTAILDANKNLDVTTSANQTAVANANNIVATHAATANKYQPVATDRTQAITDYVNNGGKVPDAVAPIADYTPNTADFSNIDKQGQTAAANPTANMNSLDAALAKQNPHFVQHAQETQQSVADAKQAALAADTAATQRKATADSYTGGNEAAITGGLRGRESDLLAQGQRNLTTAQEKANEGVREEERHKIDAVLAQTQADPNIDISSRIDRINQLVALRNSPDLMNTTAGNGPTAAQFLGDDASKFSRIEELLKKDPVNTSSVTPTATLNGDWDSKLALIKQHIGAPLPKLHPASQPVDDPAKPRNLFESLNDGASPPGSILGPTANHPLTQPEAEYQLRIMADGIRGQTREQLAGLYAKTLNDGDFNTTAILQGAMQQNGVTADDLRDFPEFKAVYKGPPSQRGNAPDVSGLDNQIPTDRIGNIQRTSTSAPLTAPQAEAQVQTTFKAISGMTLPKLAGLYAVTLDEGDVQKTAILQRAMLQLNVHADDLRAFPEFKAVYEG